MTTALPSGLLHLLCHPWIWRMAWRDARRERRRLSIFAASIVIGIGALVAIHSLRDSLEEGIGLQSLSLIHI